MGGHEHVAYLSYVDSNAEELSISFAFLRSLPSCVYTNTALHFRPMKVAIRTPVHSESGNLLLVITVQTNTLGPCGAFTLSAE